MAVVLATAAPAAAALYRWIGADGAVHYTSDLESIPEAYRDRAQPLEHPSARPPAPPGPSPGTVVPFAAGAVIVDAGLNGVPLRLLLDTGADRTMISPAALGRAGFDATGGSPVHIVGVTGTANATLVNVPRLDLAGVQVGPLAVVAHALPGQDVDGLLGRDVLDAFTVTFDAGGRRAILTPR